jgi:hypothetical protein
MPGHYSLIAKCAVAWAFAQFAHAQTSVPSWLNGRTDLLPDVPAQDIDAMRKAWPNTGLSDTYDDRLPLPDKFRQAAETIVRLRGNAAKAMIWMYAEDPPRLSYQDFRTGRAKAKLIRDLIDDGAASKLLVPLLRHRLNWATTEFRQGNIDQTWFSAGEFGAIEGYLAIHGTDDDLRRAYKLQDEFRASKTRIGSQLYPVVETPQQRWQSSMFRRESRLKRLKPYYAFFQWNLEVKRPGVQNGEHPSQPKMNSNSQQLGIRTQSKAPSPTASPSEEPTSSTPWSMIVVLMVAAGVLLWLLPKRRS